MHCAAQLLASCEQGFRPAPALRYFTQPRAGCGTGGYIHMTRHGGPFLGLRPMMADVCAAHHDAACVMQNQLCSSAAKFRAPAADLVSRWLVPGFSFVAFPRGEQWDSYMPGGSGWHIRPTSTFRGCACSVRVYNSSAPGSLHANAAFCRGSYSVDNLVQEQGRTFAVFIYYLDANR